MVRVGGRRVATTAGRRPAGGVVGHRGGTLRPARLPTGHCLGCAAATGRGQTRAPHIATSRPTARRPRQAPEPTGRLPGHRNGTSQSPRPPHTAGERGGLLRPPLVGRSTRVGHAGASERRAAGSRQPAGGQPVAGRRAASREWRQRAAGQQRVDGSQPRPAGDGSERQAASSRPAAGRWQPAATGGRRQRAAGSKQPPSSGAGSFRRLVERLRAVASRAERRGWGPPPAAGATWPLAPAATRRRRSSS